MKKRVVVLAAAMAVLLSVLPLSGCGTKAKYNKGQIVQTRLDGKTGMVVTATDGPTSGGDPTYAVKFATAVLGTLDVKYVELQFKEFELEPVSGSEPTSQPVNR